MATYIFDFDGTLADSFVLVCEILMNNAEYLGCRQLTAVELLQLRNMHAREALKHLNVPLWRLSFFVRKLRQLANQQVEEITIFPEWVTMLQQLHRHHQIGLISSNSYNTVELVLKKHHLFELFDFIHCDKSLGGKKRCLKKLIKQRSLNPLTTYYVGDEVRDIEAAHATQIRSIAVSWGFNSSTRLQLANPHHLISEITQFGPFAK